MQTIQEAIAAKGMTMEEATASVKEGNVAVPAPEVVNQEQSEEQALETNKTTPTLPETNTEEEDIVSKVIKYKPETKQVDSDSQESSDSTTTKFNVKDIDKITDPDARKYAESAYKSLEKGYQEKFQALAAERKALEQQQSESAQWTPERVQSLLSNQEFIQASQKILEQTNPTSGELSDDEWSALSTKEKTEFKLMQTKLQQMEESNKQTQMQQQLDQQITELSNKYASFDQSKVMNLLTDINAGKFSATLEHIHKVVDYEDAIRRAYAMGKEDRQSDIQEKSSIATQVDGSRTVPNTEDVAQREGESNKDFLMRRISERLKERQNKK